MLNHKYTDGARELPPVFGAVVDAISFFSFDLGIMVPGSGCLFPRFQDTLIAQTVAYIAVGLLFLASYACYRKPEVLSYFVEFGSFFLPSVTRTLFQVVAWRAWLALARPPPPAARYPPSPPLPLRPSRAPSTTVAGARSRGCSPTTPWTAAAARTAGRAPTRFS